MSCKRKFTKYQYFKLKTNEMVFSRESFIKQVEERNSWDVIVVGGGATGLGTAVDAASRGYSTLLLEQSDFAKGTSSRSTKLVHALFPDYNRAVAQMGIPFFQALGNHDQDYRLGGDETADKTFKEIYGPTYYSFNRGKAHYVVLDDVRYLGVERTYDGYIMENQLNWLAQDLKHDNKME